MLHADVSVTKGYIINRAGVNAGIIGDFHSDFDSLQKTKLLGQLELMMSEWSDHQNIQIGYNLAPSPDSATVDQDSGLALGDVQAVAWGLVLECYSMFGFSAEEYQVLQAKAIPLMNKLIPIVDLSSPKSGQEPQGSGRQTTGQMAFYIREDGSLTTVCGDKLNFDDGGNVEPVDLTDVYCQGNDYLENDDTISYTQPNNYLGTNDG